MAKHKRQNINKCNTDGRGKWKTIFHTRTEAEKAMTFIWGNDASIEIGDLHVYVCPKCRKFHVGHDRDAVAKKQENSWK